MNWQTYISRFTKLISTQICQTFVIGMIAICASATVSFAQTSQKNIDNDYGKETIDEIKPETMPVDLVQEKDQEQGTPKKEAKELKESGEEEGPETPQSKSQKFTTMLDVRDADITALVKAISKATKRNYIIDSRVKGKITVHLPTPVSEEEALKIFDSVLLLNGFTTVPTGKNIWKIIPSKEAKQTTIPFASGTEREPSDSLVTELLPMKYVKAEDMQQLLTQFIGADGGINSFSGTNSLLVIDSAQNIARLRKLIEQLDVPARDQDITIIPISYAEAKDVADKITQILGESGKEGGTAGGTGTAQATAGASFTPRSNVAGKGSSRPSGQNVEQRSLPIKIIPDERTNSIICVADPEMTAKVRALAEKLDSEIDRSGSRFYVYRLKHADSDTLSEILNGLISGSPVTSTKKEGTTGSSLTRSRNKSSDSYSGSSTSRSRYSSSKSQKMGTDSTRDTSQRATGTAQTGGGTGTGARVAFEGEITIASDSSTNSLIINAGKTDYLRLKDIIQELDIKRRQVLVEATILEVKLTHNDGLSVELQGSSGNDNGAGVVQSNLGNLSTILTDPSSLSDFTMAAASSGTITLPGGLVIPSQALLVHAFSKNQNVNVLSTPTILATDNEEAEIVVGENVPFVTGRSTDSTNLNSTYNEIDRQDVGITLRITPQISTGEYVMLKIFVEISDVVSSTRNDANGPTTTIRTTETAVEVKSNQMIVTGGLIRDENSSSDRGVPYLQDIPVLGNLFLNREETQGRTNLLVFLTPRIVYDQFDAREQTKEFSGKLEDAIKRDNSKPSREEVLRNPKMDHVVEQAAEEVTIPTTVTSPSGMAPTAEDQGAIERTKKRLALLAKSAASAAATEAQSSTQPTASTTSETKALSNGNTDTIRMNVSPELPGAQTKSSSTTTMAGKTYVVLRAVDFTDDSNQQNILFADQKGTLGLIVNSETVVDMFKVGTRMVYNDGENEHEYVVLGQFPSMASAQRIAPALVAAQKWNTLTSSTVSNWSAK